MSQPVQQSPAFAARISQLKSECSVDLPHRSTTADKFLERLILIRRSPGRRLAADGWTASGKPRGVIRTKEATAAIRAEPFMWLILAALGMAERAEEPGGSDLYGGWAR